MYGVSREEEIMRYLPLIDQVIYRLSIKSVDYDYDDLFNMGVIGLMDALKKFNPEKKVPFDNYARVRIKGAIIDEVRKHSKISRYKIASLNEYYSARRELEQTQKREVTDLEVAKFMNITMEQLSDIHESLHYLANVSLEDTLFVKDSESYSALNTVPDTSIESAEGKVLKEEQERILGQCIRKLSEREQIILSLYYQEELTLKEIAAVLDISIPRVSQLHGKILIKLRKLIEEENQ